MGIKEYDFWGIVLKTDIQAFVVEDNNNIVHMYASRQAARNALAGWGKKERDEFTIKKVSTIIVEA